MVAIAIVLLTTALIRLSHADATLVNIPPIYVLSVQGVAVLLGSRPAVVASLVAFLCFDWFFVDPKYQLTVRDPFEFVALCVFVVSAILVGQLTALFRNRAEEAHQREQAATALARASWTVASELEQETAILRVLEELQYVSSADSAILVRREDGGQLQSLGAYGRKSKPAVSMISGEAISFVESSRRTIGWDKSEHWDKALSTGGDISDLYLPVDSEGKLLAILFVRRSHSELSTVDRQIITSLVNHLAVVLQRGLLLESRSKAQALAETNRLKTALLQMVSHDFRSPLSSIKASVSSLLSDEGEPLDAATQHSLLQAIEQESDRLNKMVGNLLDLSRLEADAWKPQRELCLLSELIGSALDTFNAQENQRIRLNVPKEPIDIAVDPVQIIQVLRNLVENALKYSTGQVELDVSTASDFLFLAVIDDGPGLPADSEEQIFEPFYRAQQHQESSVPGMGMGLAVCRGLIEAHGGTLTANNRPEGGARFLVKLPMETKQQ